MLQVRNTKHEGPNGTHKRLTPITTINVALYYFSFINTLVQKMVLGCVKWCKKNVLIGIWSWI